MKRATLTGRRTRTPIGTRASQQGMTLIELMIALAIMAIVAAVAIPIYTSYTERGFKSQVQADLMNCAQGMERHASLSFSYENAATGGDPDDGPPLATICRPDSIDNYTFNVLATANTFTLIATPTTANPIEDAYNAHMDEAGNRGYDINGDGDILDTDEAGWPDH